MTPAPKDRHLSPTSRIPSSKKSGNFVLFPPRARLAAVGVVLLLVAALFLFRLVSLQVISPDKYVAWGDAQRSRTFQITAPRGDILDRNGEQLAVSLKSTTIWADPQLVTEPQLTAVALTPVLNMDYTEILNRLTKSNSFVYLKRKVSEETARQLNTMDLPGIFTLTEYKRNSPAGANLGLALVGSVGSEEQGLSGVEAYYEDVLGGSPGRVSLEGNVFGVTVDPSLRYIEPAQPGKNLLLSLDKGLQYEAERLIVDAVEEYEALSGTIVATIPATGEILAMATAALDDEVVEIMSENRAITWAYEPGSVIKALTFSAVLETGIGEPTSVREVPDHYVLYDARFSDHDPHPPQNWSIADIVIQSSNVGTILWAQDLGKTYLDYYLREFGLGAKSGINLPSENKGIVRRTKDYSGTSLATIPYGQGISTTPLQLLFGFNTIANGGVYVPPKLVLATADGDKWQPADSEIESRRVISEDTATQMSQILKGVVEEGTGTEAQIDGFSVAGKTGTARKPQDTGGYRDEDGNFHYITTFAGFYPAENPEISIIVVIEEPQNSIYASTTAVPVFADFAAFTAGRLGIAPTVRQISSSIQTSS